MSKHTTTTALSAPFPVGALTNHCIYCVEALSPVETRMGRVHCATCQERRLRLIHLRSMPLYTGHSERQTNQA